MPVSGDGFEQAYNAQAGVDAATMLTEPGIDGPAADRGNGRSFLCAQQSRLGERAA